MGHKISLGRNASPLSSSVFSTRQSARLLASAHHPRLAYPVTETKTSSISVDKEIVRQRGFLTWFCLVPLGTPAKVFYPAAMLLRTVT